MSKRQVRRSTRTKTTSSKRYPQKKAKDIVKEIKAMSGRTMIDDQLGNELQGRTQGYWFTPPMCPKEAAKSIVKQSKPIAIHKCHSFAEDVTCCVCLEPLNEAEEGDQIIQLSKCKGHYFHSDCIKSSLEHMARCPVCFQSYGAMIGTQPPGTMTVNFEPSNSLPGFEGVGYFTINYQFPGGRQTDTMPKPGVGFSGTARTAFLPNTAKGRLVLALFKKAWDHRQLFRVGQSITTGCDNTTVWNGIHHKTTIHGGPFGYPDATYLDRVLEELAAYGLTESLLEQ